MMFPACGKKAWTKEEAVRPIYTESEEELNWLICLISHACEHCGLRDKRICLIVDVLILYKNVVQCLGVADIQLRILSQ